ncbi:MAG: anti-sigma regulatory factor [Chloroflexi bacterium]|nr:anti-sigma regulatory factor [Chloroflexota bacterium]
MTVNERRIEIKCHSDIVSARQAGRQMAYRLGFGSADQTRLATAISELTSNAIRYAGGGVCIVTNQSNQCLTKVQVVVEDHGPGIPDIEQAMKDGFSTGGSLGVGLPGSKRLVHEFDIESKPGYTKITIAMVRQTVRLS